MMGTSCFFVTIMKVGTLTEVDIAASRTITTARVTKVVTGTTTTTAMTTAEAVVVALVVAPGAVQAPTMPEALVAY